jgi:hypothetical protein
MPSNKNKKTKVVLNAKDETCLPNSRSPVAWLEIMELTRTNSLG